MLRDDERAEAAKSAYLAGEIDTTAHPVVRRDALLGPSQPNTSAAPVERDLFAQSIPGVALATGALADEAPAAPTPATREDLRLGKRILSWRTLVPLAVVLVILALALKSLATGFNPATVAQDISQTNPLYYALAVVAYYLSFVVRTVRWRLLLVNVGIDRDPTARLPGLGKLGEILFLSWFANAVVPAKLGDVYRAYLLKQTANVSGTRSFGTVLAERLLDFIVLLLLFVGAALANFTEITAALNPNIRATLQLGLFALAGVSIAGVVALVLLRLLREPIRRRVPARFQRQYDDFQQGTLGSFKRVPLLLLLTVLVWLCEAARFLFVAKSIHLLPGLLHTAFFAAMFVALGESLLTVVPFTSGGIGIVEAGMLAMLLVFVHGPDAQNHAAAAVALDRLISLVSVLALGGLLYLFVFVRGARQRATL